MAIREPSPDALPAPTARPLAREEWAALRELRLRALQAEPDAFEDTYDGARRRQDADWCALLDACAAGAQVALVCEDAEGLSGIAWVRLETAEAPGAPAFARPVARLSNMWVEPRARSNGVGRCLLATGERWAAEHGAAELRLWVNEANTPALRLYERAGYARTGRTEPLRPGSPIETVELARTLAP